MPLYDYACSACGQRLDDVYHAIAEVGEIPMPSCACGATMYRVQGCGAIDAKEPFQRFTVDVNGRPTEVSSLNQVRQIERASEQAYRNGEGEPLRFRGYANDHSNLDRNTFGHQGKLGDREYSDGQAPTPKAVRDQQRAEGRRRKGQISTIRHGSKAPTVKLGPGMGGQAATALKG